MSDQTVYLAEAARIDDRRSSFSDLIEISGVNHSGLQCHTMEALYNRAFRDDIAAQWIKDRLARCPDQNADYTVSQGGILFGQSLNASRVYFDFNGRLDEECNKAASSRD